MTQTPYILWAVLATGGGIWAGAKWLQVAKLALTLNRQIQQSFVNWDRLQGMFVQAQRGRRSAEESMESMASALAAAEQALRDIQARRKASAKHARQAQLSQQRAKVLEQASKLVAPKVDRIAA